VGDLVALTAVGDTVGRLLRLVGAAVGLALGRLVACRVGVAEGLAVGLRVLLVGVVVGFRVRLLWVGRSVGIADGGMDVGCCVAVT
jgi:hypothetical protein